MATAVYNTQPFMLVALGALVFRERITASTVAWLLVAFIGLVFVVRVEPAVLAVPGQYSKGSPMRSARRPCTRCRRSSRSI